MAEYEHATTVQASPDAVFAFLSDVGNLPKYLPTVKHAAPQSGDHVQVEGEANGHQYSDDGFLRVDQANNRMEWGADEQDYAGHMTVDGDNQQSNVTIHLSFREKNGSDEHIPDQDERIQRGLVAALESIRNHVEGKGGKQEVAEAQR